MTTIYLTAEPNDVLRRFSSLFKPYFKKSGDWDAVVHRLFNNLICQIKLDNMSLSMQLKNTSNGVR